MAAHELDPAILSFYRDRYVEDERLTRTPHGQLEFVRTQQLLRRHLPPAPAAVADIGGGTGVHARWLAADGYQVQLVDPVAEHVDRARAIVGVQAGIGDARALAMADFSVDVSLLLWPIHHLVDERDRGRALAETGPRPRFVYPSITPRAAPASAARPAVCARRSRRRPS